MRHVIVVRDKSAGFASNGDNVGMEKLKAPNAARGFVRAVRGSKRGRYIFRLYVAGLTLASLRAIESVKTFCDLRLGGRYELEIVDISQQPTLAASAHIITVPTLLKVAPSPPLKFMGDMSTLDRVSFGPAFRPNRESQDRLYG
ncbi:MAG TPA: circadian clock KaiB family protein [Terriglobia bacterium]|nr:circadian clock KaiB family protein [Terriglobia bacterium]